MSNAVAIAQAFNASAKRYDGERRILIPCFDDFYGAALDCLEPVAGRDARLLDLGAGTGLMSTLVRARFGAMALTLIDVADGLLAKARAVLPDAQYRVADYTHADLGGPYEAIYSGLSIHHLSDAQKRDLYRHIHDALAPGGVFVNADQVLGSTPALEAGYRAQWLASVRARGASEEMVAAALERMKQDRMAPLEDQLDWLREAGLADVDCVYKNYSFAVMAGRRAA